MKKFPTKKIKIVSVEQAESRLEAMCARAEHCTYELRQKLWQWKIQSDNAEKIMARLIEKRFVDDARFTRSFVRDKVNFSRWGERKIHAALLAKKIPAGMIREALKDIDEKVFEENLKIILTQKAKNIPEVRTYQGRTKLFRYAITRGYSPDLVSKFIRLYYV